MWTCNTQSADFDAPDHYDNCRSLIQCCVEAYQMDPAGPLDGTLDYEAIDAIGSMMGNGCSEAYNYIVDNGYGPNYNQAWLLVLRGACATIQNDIVFLGQWNSNSGQAVTLYGLICSMCQDMDDPLNLGYPALANPFELPEKSRISEVRVPPPSFAGDRPGKRIKLALEGIRDLAAKFEAQGLSKTQAKERALRESPGWRSAK